MIGFLIGFGAGFLIWNMGFSAGKVLGKELAAEELLQFLEWLEPVDRMIWKQKFRDFQKEVLTNDGSDARVD